VSGVAAGNSAEPTATVAADEGSPGQHIPVICAHSIHFKVTSYARDGSLAGSLRRDFGSLLR
jgi:hypothetical protein